MVNPWVIDGYYAGYKCWSTCLINHLPLLFVDCYSYIMLNALDCQSIQCRYWLELADVYCCLFFKGGYIGGWISISPFASFSQAWWYIYICVSRTKLRGVVLLPETYWQHCWYTSIDQYQLPTSLKYVGADHQGYCLLCSFLGCSPEVRGFWPVTILITNSILLVPGLALNPDSLHDLKYFIRQKAWLPSIVSTIS